MATTCVSVAPQANFLGSILGAESAAMPEWVGDTSPLAEESTLHRFGSYFTKP